MKYKKRTLWLVLLPMVILTLLFTVLFFKDNKYETPPPYGRNGVTTLKESDFERNQPLFLIDGWLLTDSRVTDQPTYIGEFSNLQRGDRTTPPHGEASYQMTLSYSGADVEVVIGFPQLFSTHTIILDGKTLSDGTGGARHSFTLTEGEHKLVVKTASAEGYYSGMYHPPILGRTEAVFRTILISCIAYGIAFFVPLALSLFTLVLWRSAKDSVALWFGLLCCSFSMYVSYYFVRLLSLPFEQWWYLVQSMALYGLCFCTLRLTALTGGRSVSKLGGWIQGILMMASALLLGLALLIPVFPWVVRLHSILTDAYYLFTFCAVLLLAFRSKAQQNWEGRFTLLACTVFGVGLFINLFFSNLFEPILFFWQFEWCGLFLVALFGATMVARNKRILMENKTFSEHLEELVQQRTKELRNLLEERKVFFADMAHDLKAPLFATGAFIQAIREHDTGVDSELLRYIDQVEQKQREMTRRVQGLSTLNKMDEIPEQWEVVSVWALLDEAYQTHHMAAEVQSVYLVIERPEVDGLLFAGPRKLAIVLENLVFNALYATKPGGTITIGAEIDEGECHLIVADTGSGIPIEALPHIFERFYVGKEKKSSGSGLGLYIVKSIVEEQGGEITVSSKPGQGTAFYIDLPLKKN